MITTKTGRQTGKSLWKWCLMRGTARCFCRSGRVPGIGILTVVLLFSSVTFFAAAQSYPPSWVQLQTINSPPPRWGHVMDYDSLRGRTVLFGGSSGSRETWELDGTTWTLRSISGPSGSPLGAMAYDSTRGRSVLFGGINAQNETWAWDGRVWRQIATRGPAPSARSVEAMAYDSVRDRVVLFGGRSNSSGLPLRDTWELEGGTTWTLRSQTGPPARYSHAMVYDVALQRTVLFGGWDGSTFLNDTWEWDGTQWQMDSTSSAPSARWSHAMVYDSDRQRIVLFGGEGDQGRLNDTWEWDGTNWLWRSRIGPAPRLYHAMAYDSALHRTVLFGGYEGTDPGVGDTWAYEVPAPSVFAQQIVNAILGRTNTDPVFDTNSDGSVDVGDVVRVKIP